MRLHYNIYPEALDIIRSAGLDSRVDELSRSDGLQYIVGATYTSDIVESVSDLKGRGYYDRFPEELKDLYKQVMNGMVSRPEEYSWTVRRQAGEERVPCELEDMLLFSGDIASMILGPLEMWDHGKLGFSGPIEQVSVTGAYIKMRSNEILPKRGYVWERRMGDGSVIVSEITGDMHADMRIFQTDIAPYPTKDPFGLPVRMRPVTDEDQKVVAAYHTTEGMLFIATLKYIEQCGISSDVLADGAKEFISWARSLGQSGGTCTEHFGGFDQEPWSFFYTYKWPLPQLGEGVRSGFNLVSAGDISYGVFVDSEDLVISYKDKVCARFVPEDADHLLRGLMHQCAKGLGRTSAKQLLSILEYWFGKSYYS